MAWNPAILTTFTGWQTDKAIPGLKMTPKALKVISDMELGNPYTLLEMRYENREIFKWCRRKRMFQKANACL